MSTLLVIVASVRPTRIGGAVAEWVLEHATQRSGFEVEVADLRELDLPIMNEPHHPRLKQYEYEHTRQWSAIVDDADGFIIVTPEYNHSIPGALKNAMDYLLQEWRGKPVGVVSYGGVSAGTRATVALQVVLANFAMRGTAANVEIQWVAQRIDERGAFVTDERLDAVLEAQLDELAALLS
ncbi:NADPH-dependent FMN reductase [Gryllotalpicola protaetiae]|uniref:NADPH-dependent oxidoreductase n=1 Tax=Gryllotalpicola protaetiae TaxID=2419771 RepID=A0A387BN95_9MICO|nr:NAD(P)H-dependent oxidoreductase [Gryllotalpicola protaetiae]AYG02510.1 NADPH-dependent oxidoreductase [Gryllotalpicola protaetiae]